MIGPAWRLAVLAMIAMLASYRAHGHATSTSYLTVDATRSKAAIAAHWHLSVRDLHWLIDLDPDADGRITWGEVEARREAIGALAAAHLNVRRGGASCTQSLADVRLTAHADEPHLALSLPLKCPRAGPLEIGADLFFAEDASQRTLLDVRTASHSWTSVLSPDAARWVQPVDGAAWNAFRKFLWQGMWHVWIGFDHVAFLILLLLPSVVRTRTSEAAPTANEAAIDVAKVVTAFTLAHSLTLGLAATGVVNLPSGPVEAAIAASIVVAGAVNLIPRLTRLRLWLAFAFGLVHGFGFANALSELGSGGLRLLPALGGFNLGVELGQLAIVAVVLPALLRLRLSLFYRVRMLPAASIAIAMLGGVWLAARIP